MTFSRAHVHAHYSDFRVFAFTTFTENSVTYYVSIRNMHFSNKF